MRTKVIGWLQQRREADQEAEEIGAAALGQRGDVVGGMDRLAHRHSPFTVIPAQPGISLPFRQTSRGSESAEETRDPGCRRDDERRDDAASVNGLRPNSGRCRSRPRAGR